MSGPDDPAWRRLDRRMLLVHPVNDLLRLLPAVAIALVAGTTAGGDARWSLLVLAAGVGIGVLRWVSTTYRVGPTTVQLRRGLLGRRVTTVPRERIRTVDVEAKVLHRVLGLAVVRVGTGQSGGRRGEEGLELDALPARDVPALRAELLGGGAPGHDPAPADGGSGADGGGGADRAVDGPELTGWRPSWVRYAPLTLAGVASLGVVAGGVSQLAGSGGRSGSVRRGLAEALGLARSTNLVVLLAGLALVAVVLSSVLAAAAYLLGYWGFRLTRRDGGPAGDGPGDSASDLGGTLHVAHGLLRTRATTVDRARVRGVDVAEPLLQRLVGAARLTSVSTGVGEHDGAGSTDLLCPTGPRAAVDRAGGAVLGDPAPLHHALHRHGRAARRRRWTRSGSGVAALLAGLVAARVTVGLPGAAWWLVLPAVLLGAAAAEGTYRGLGHALVGPWLVVRRGWLLRHRVVLARSGVIGAVVRASPAQRWSGVVTVRFTTAAGRGRYDVVDVDRRVAYALVSAVAPAAIGPWRPVDNPVAAGPGATAVCQPPRP